MTTQAYGGDFEKGVATDVNPSPAPSTSVEITALNAKQAPSGIFGRLRYYESLLDAKLGIEAEAIDRVLPEQKTHQPWHSQAVMALMWASATMNLSCFATGFLGHEFGLDLKQTILLIIFSSLLGSAVTGWCATMGPATGLRQVAISRYSFGWWPSKIIAILNVIEQLGWSSVSCITGGSALSAVSDGHVSMVVGVIIISVIGCVFSFVGLKGVLQVEKYQWMVIFVIFMAMYGQVASHAEPKSPPQYSGATLSGQVLSLLSVIYGSSASWSSIVSDYYVHYPVNTSKTKVFLLTTLGISIPTSIGMVLGACVGSTMGVNQEWADTYDDQGLGYLVQLILYPRGWAKFVLVILTLSGIGMCCIAIYSCSLSIQQFARPLAVVPRIFWTILVFIGILLLGLAGRDKLSAYLQNFLSLLGYWNTSFFVILASEHYIFRKGDIACYDLDAWNDPSRLPIGIAGMTAFCLGVVGWVLGMVQTWFTGPIAMLIGDYGGDVANELALVFTAVGYIPVRYLELKWMKR